MTPAPSQFHPPSRLLSCDWGTSSLRLRLLAAGDPPRVLAEYRNDEGIANLAAQGGAEPRSTRFQRTLRRAIGELRSRSDGPIDALPVVISGMAGSSIGWVSLPYAPLPFSLAGTDAGVARLQLDDHPLLLISGVRDEHDVMRGEETELIGLMRLPEARHLRGRCMAILPGTHSKHVDIIDGKIAAFRTFMSGELFSVLAAHSVLRHSVSQGGEGVRLPREAAGPAREAFIAGVRDVLENELLSALFHTRTRQLLHAQPEALNAAFLSGLLIGSEAAGLRHRKRDDEPIVLCAGSAVVEWYDAALHEAGFSSRLTIIPAAKVDQLSIWGHVQLLPRLAHAPVVEGSLT